MCEVCYTSSMVTSSSLAGAIARRNVETDGRVWCSGAIVAPTADVVARLVLDAEDHAAMHDETVNNLRRLPAAAPVAHVRAWLLPDSHETTRDGAIRTYEALAAGCREYAADIKAAGVAWAARNP
jgi:hypothetical protein